MLKIVSVEALDGHRLWIEFSDGLAGTVELTERLFGPLFEPLRDPETFRGVDIDEFGAVCWPNGADLAPDALYAKIADSDGPGPSVG